MICIIFLEYTEAASVGFAYVTYSLAIQMLKLDN